MIVVLSPYQEKRVQFENNRYVVKLAILGLFWNDLNNGALNVQNSDDYRGGKFETSASVK